MFDKAVEILTIEKSNYYTIKIVDLGANWLFLFSNLEMKANKQNRFPTFKNDLKISLLHLK